MEKARVLYAGEPQFFPNGKHPAFAHFEQVFGHPTLGDRKSVTSSQVVSVTDGVIETLNTIYVPARKD